MNREKDIKKISKLVGVTLPEKEDLDYEQILKNRQKWGDYCEIVQFTLQSGRRSIVEFMHKVKKVVDNYINKSPFYKEVNEKDLKQYAIDIRKNLRFKQVKSYALDRNDGKWFISFDIKSANYTSLQLISKGILDQFTWPQFLRSLVPNDVRSDSKKNVEHNVAGLTLEIPNCLYESKHFRQFLLGDAKKLRFVWELENLKYLALLCETNVKDNNNVCVNSDEIVIECDSLQNARELIQQLPKSAIHRCNIFQIKKIDEENGKNFVLKILEDGTKRLMNVDPSLYDKLYTKYISNSFLL